VRNVARSGFKPKGSLIYFGVARRGSSRHLRRAGFNAENFSGTSTVLGATIRWK